MNIRQQARLRIGKIDYANVWPVFHHFPEQARELIEWVPQVPSQLNRAMAAGEVDLGAISSFAYAEHFDQYELLPDLSVSSFGPVYSVLLFYRGKLDDLRFGRIALPTTSATSVHLLKVIFQKFYDADPEYFYAEPKLEDMMKEADAALLIGDDAIRASFADHGYNIMDLGDWWNRLTGQWMTFAVWAVRKETIKRHPLHVQAVYQAFSASKRISLHQPASMIEKARKEIGGTAAYWQTYFRELCYEFAAPQQKGLALYYQYLHELGFLRENVPIQVWKNNTVA